MDRHLDGAPSPDEHLADLVAAYQDRQLQDGEFTIRMWAEMADIPANIAERQIYQAIDDGKVEQVGDVQSPDTKRRCKAFRKV